MESKDNGCGTQTPLGAVTTLRVVNRIVNLIDPGVARNEARVTHKVLSRLLFIDDQGLSQKVQAFQQKI